MSVTVKITPNDGSRAIFFDVPTEWENITLKHWSELAYIIKKHQNIDELKRNSISDSIDVSEEEYNTILNNSKFLNEAQLNRDIFCYLSGLDKHYMKSVNMEQVTQVINAIGILTEEYEPKGINSFELDGETYYFPSEFLKKNTYGDFIEATQLDMTVESMRNGRYDVLPEQMAILCRKSGEEYDDEAIPEKAEKFKQLTMDIVFEFAFFLTNQNQKLLKLSSMFLEKKENQ
jgi:hypothetical protein